MMKRPKMLCGLGLALSLEVGCAHQVEISRDLIDKLGIRNCSETIGSNIAINFSRFGNPNDLPNCNDTVETIAFNGVSSDSATWAPLAHQLNEEDKRKFMAVNLSGEGISALGLSEEEVNPASITEKLKIFLERRSNNSGKTVLLGHSAGGAVAILAGSEIEDAEIIVYNPVLGSKSSDVYLPSRSAPYACNFSLTPHILRRGAVAEKTGVTAPGLFSLTKEEIGKNAQSSNVCLNIFDQNGNLISEPCEQTPTERLRNDLERHCETARGYTNSVRQNSKIGPWRSGYEEAIEKTANRITVILASGDGVLDPKKTREVILKKYPQISVVTIEGGSHEVITSHPRTSAEALYTSLNGGSFEDILLADQ